MNAWSGYYILKGREIVRTNVETWARWFQNADRHVAQSNIAGLHVSTVFLGLDHGIAHGRPILFETMVFDGDWNDLRCERCCTYAEAEVQHLAICQEIERAAAVATAAIAEHAKPEPTE